MPYEFLLPDLGEGLEEAEVIRWLVAPGEEVARDQSLVEIQTDKALVEIPAPVAGTMSSLAAEVGAIVKVGELLFVIAGNGDGGVKAPSSETKEVSAPADPEPVAVMAQPGSSRKPRPKAAPAVRRLATELGIVLADVVGSGASGRILAEDVRGHVAQATVPMTEVAGVVEAPESVGAEAPSGLGQATPGVMPLAGLRRVTAQVMSRAWETIPHIHGFDEIDATALLDCHRKLRQKVGEGESPLTVTAFLAMAACQALRRYPLVNASLDLERKQIRVHGEINLGIAAATPDGLIVPVIRNAGQRSLLDLAAEIDRLAKAARTRKIKAAELQGGTFTLTNYGAIGGRFAAPIIRPPEAGILGFGAIRERAIAVEGRVEARPTLPLCFGADHRLIDGDLSVAFQECVRELLTDPINLLIGPGP